MPVYLYWGSTNWHQPAESRLNNRSLFLSDSSGTPGAEEEKEEEHQKVSFLHSCQALYKHCIFVCSLTYIIYVNDIRSLTACLNPSVHFGRCDPDIVKWMINEQNVKKTSLEVLILRHFAQVLCGIFSFSTLIELGSARNHLQECCVWFLRVYQWFEV